MPGHRVVRGGDRNAGEALELAVASATRRLVQETKIVSTPGALARRTIPASIEATEMRAASRSSRRSKVAAAATSISRARKLAISVSVDLGRVRGQEPDHLCAKRAKAASAAVTGVVQATPGRLCGFRRTPMFAERHRRRGAAKRDDVELEARQNQADARRDPRPDGAQGVGRDLGVVKDARLVERDAGQIDEGANSCSIVWSVARTTRPIAARRRDRSSSSEGSTPRSIGSWAAGWARGRETSEAGLPSSSGHEAVHGESPACGRR